MAVRSKGAAKVIIYGGAQCGKMSMGKKSLSKRIIADRIESLQKQQTGEVNKALEPNEKSSEKYDTIELK